MTAVEWFLAWAGAWLAVEGVLLAVTALIRRAS